MHLSNHVRMGCSVRVCLPDTMHVFVYIAALVGLGGLKACMSLCV